MKDDRFDCWCEHALAWLARRLMRGELTRDEHAQAVRDLDPETERLVARMTAIASGATWTA